MHRIDRMEGLPAPTYEERIARLKSLRSALLRDRETLVQAIQKDFARSREEILMADLMIVISDLNLVIQNLHQWMKPRPVATPLTLWGTKSTIHYRPKGMVLVLSPWNYPLFLSLSPAIGAWAAGNRVVIKPSEWLPSFGHWLMTLVAEIFEPEEMCVVQGDARVAAELVGPPFNHIFFTGGGATGQKVLTAAAAHHIPVTLELGGKCPVIIDSRYSIRKAARRIAVAKMMNAGQTCVGPDYVMCPTERVDELIEALGKEFDSRWVAGNQSPMIHGQAFQRLQTLYKDALSKGAECAYGGKFDAEEWVIQPTVLTGLTSHMRIEKEEIFGPLLPIFAYSDPSDIVEQVRINPEPLALYIYSDSTAFRDPLLTQLPAGGVTINDQHQHLIHPQLPFGGVGRSGLGAYRGRHGFATFTHAQGVTVRKGGTPLRTLYPPFGFFKRRLLGGILRFFSRWL